MGAFLAQFFMNPLFLVGVASAGVPVIIHLIHRRKAPKLPFSTLRFLRVSNERTARRQHLQDIFLLLLRALICALLAIALARPFLPASDWTDGPVAAAIILDNSLSMSAEDEGEPRFTAAKEAALGVLRQLGGRARVVLVQTNPPERSGAPSPTTDLAALERQILGSSASAGRGNLPAAVEQARKILEEVREPNKQIFVISDLQKSSWASSAASPEETTLSKHPVIIIDCGSKDTANAAVTDVNIRARSRVEGESITIEARLLNFGPRAVTQTATLYVDGEARDHRRVTLAPGVPVVASFTHTFSKPGMHTGWVAIGDDRLKTDNLRSFSIGIQERLDVLIVEDEKAAVSFLADSFYLAKALDPVGSEAALRSAIRPVRVLTAAVEGERLSEYNAVCLVNVARISPGLAALLKEYVRQGGGLVVFAGDRIDPGHYNEVLADPTKPLIPVEFGEVRGGAGDRTEFRRITDTDYSHPVLARFKGESMFNDVRVYQYVSTEVGGRSAATLIALGDGSPFLIENKYDNGTVYLFATSSSDDWSNFPLRQAYLPLLHEIIYYVSRGESVKEGSLVGSPVRLTFPDGGEAVTVSVTTPAGRRYKVESVSSSDSCVAVFPLTGRPGIYSWQGDRSQPSEGAFAVNPDARESDLQQEEQSQVERAPRSEKVFVVSSLDEVHAALKRLREGLPLLDYFFLIVLVIAVFECFFSNLLTPSAPAEVRKSKLGLVTTGARGDL